MHKIIFIALLSISAFFENAHSLVSQFPISNLEVSGTTNYNTLSSGVSEEKPSMLMLKFFDVGTGIAVLPVKVEIKSHQSDRRYGFSRKDISESGVLNVPLEDDVYDVMVFADGYKPMSSFFSFEHNSLNVNFNLEPIQPTKQLTSLFIEQLHTKESIAIVGYVVDDDTGKPVEGVSVFSEDNKVKALSGKDGFFQLILPLPNDQSEIARRGILHFEKVGYTNEIRTNFDMWPNGDMILQIRFHRGSGNRSEEIIKTRTAAIVTIAEVKGVK